MNSSFILLAKILLGVVLVMATAIWLSRSVLAKSADGPYVHAECCASHGGCKDTEKCATGAACCSNDDCGECCGASRNGVPVCGLTKSAGATARRAPSDSLAATDSLALAGRIRQLRAELARLEQQLVARKDSLNP